jgi:hypothetical protein
MKKISRKQARKGARCAWCGKLPDLRGVLVLLAKCHAGVTLPEGVTCYPFQLSSGKVVRAIVGTEDSQMKADGWDCGFPVCSEDCGHLLTAALRREGVLLEAELN